MKNLCNDLGGIKLGISGDVYGYYKNGTLVGFKSQADIDAAYQSGYNAGVAAGETTHTGTYTITTNGTTDLGVHHTYRYIDTSVTSNINNLIGIAYVANMYWSDLGSSTGKGAIVLDKLDDLENKSYPTDSFLYMNARRVTGSAGTYQGTLSLSMTNKKSNYEYMANIIFRSGYDPSTEHNPAVTISTSPTLSTSIKYSIYKFGGQAVDVNKTMSPGQSKSYTLAVGMDSSCVVYVFKA